MKTKVPFFLAFVLAILAVFLIARWLQGQQVRVEYVDVIFARQAVRRGEEVRSFHLAAKQIPRNAYVNGMMLSGEEAAYTGGYKAQIDIAVDDPIFKGVLALPPKRREPLAPKIPDGLRGVSLPVTKIGSVSNLIELGDHVDILISLEVPKVEEQTANITNVGAVPLRQEQKEPVLVYLMQDITVIALSTQVISDVPAQFEDLIAGYDSITISATPEEASVMAFAILTGSGESPFTLLLRSPTDRAILDKVQITNFESVLKEANLSDLLSKRKAIREVEVLSAGAGGNR